MRRSAILLTLLACAPCVGGQHLIAPGQSWDDVVTRARPGDEIILMPGRHVGASLDNLRGTEDKPITIRGLTTDQPSIIDSPRDGIRLRAPQHVIIRDLAITGATIAGVTIAHETFIRDAQPGMLPQPESNSRAPEPWPAHVKVQNLTIERTGPHGRRNAIHLDGVRHVEVERVRIVGWGGSAIHIASSYDVRIENSVLRGRADHGQLNGVHVHGGSERVHISRCYIVDAGEAAVVLGAAAAPSSGEAKSSARRTIIERNVLRGGDSAIAFLNSAQCRFRNNVIVKPGRFAYFIAPPGNLLETTFTSNLTVWEPGQLEALSHVVPPSVGAKLVIERNLWWSGDSAEEMAKLGPPAGDVRSPQVMDVDPDLDEQFLPRNRDASIFGTEAP